MFCPRCGTNIETGEFCPNCGQKIRKPTTAIPQKEPRLLKAKEKSTSSTTDVYRSFLKWVLCISVLSLFAIFSGLTLSTEHATLLFLIGALFCSTVGPVQVTLKYKKVSHSFLKRQYWIFASICFLGLIALILYFFIWTIQDELLTTLTPIFIALDVFSLTELPVSLNLIKQDHSTNGKPEALVQYQLYRPFVFESLFSIIIALAQIVYRTSSSTSKPSFHGEVGQDVNYYFSFVLFQSILLIISLIFIIQNRNKLKSDPHRLWYWLYILMTVANLALLLQILISHCAYKISEVHIITFLVFADLWLICSCILPLALMLFYLHVTTTVN